MLGIAVGSLGVVTLVLLSLLRQRRAPELIDGIVTFISGLGVIGGIRVCLMSIDQRLYQIVGDDRVYIFLAGIAVLWVSIGTACGTIAKVTRSLSPTLGQQ